MNKSEFSRADWFRAMGDESIDHENIAICNATKHLHFWFLTILQPKIKDIPLAFLVQNLIVRPLAAHTCVSWSHMSFKHLIAVFLWSVSVV